MGAAWIFDVVDISGNTLTQSGVNLYDDLTVTYQRGAPAVMQLRIPLTSTLAATIASSAEADYYIKGYRTPEGGAIGDRALKFYGNVVFDEVVGQSGGDALSIVAADPQVILAQRFASTRYTPQDQGTIIKSMVDTTNSTDGETGILTSSSYITASYSIDIDLRESATTIASVIDQFGNLLDATTVWVEPMEYASGKIGKLYAAARRGSSSTAVFAYGAGTLANCSTMTRVRDKSKIENTITGISDTLTVTKTNAASIAALRNLVAYQSFTGETSLAKLTARTLGRLNERSTKARVAEYSIAPDVSAPHLFDDFDIDDDVTLHFRQGVEWQVTQRVVSATIRVTNGIEYLDSVEFRTYD